MTLGHVIDLIKDALTPVKSALQVMQPAATNSDIGKALLVKTVENGKPASWEYGKATVEPEDIATAADAWLEENITNPDSPPLDRSLSSSSSASPADIVGDVEKIQGHAILSGTYSGTRYISVDKTIAPGKYHIHIDSVTSTDTDKTVCRFAFLNSSSQDVLVELFNRNVAIDIDITIPSEVAKVAMYASSVYAYAANDTFAFTGLVISKRYDLLDTVNGLSSKAPVFDNYDIKTLKVFDSFTLNHNSYTFSEGATIQNYANYATESSTYYNTKPIRIRNSDGGLIYKNLHVTPKDASTNCAWTFDYNGAFLRAVTFTAMASREIPFLSDEYYVILNEFPTTSGYTDVHWYVSNIDIGWLNGKNEYVVGDGGDFATFTAMLIALENDKREKTVYVKGGTYDIFDEMGGAEYITTVAPSASELNWRDVCHVVPPNTTIIGMGNVVLSWQPTAQQMVNETTAFLFSPLNVSGTCRIENITVVAKNCRYVVHDETNGLPEFDGAKRCFKNCKFTLLEGSYGFICYGAGHNKLMDVLFEDCVIESENSSLIWSTHDWATEANNNSVFVINNCIFTSTKSDPNVRFSTNDTVGKLDKVTFNNCYLEKVKFVTTSGSDAKQGYDVQLIGCAPVLVEYDEHVTDRVAVRQYNPIPQSN